MTNRTPKTTRLLASFQEGVTFTPSAIRHQFGLVDAYAAVRLLRLKGYAIYANPTRQTGRGRRSPSKVTYRLGTPSRSMVTAATEAGVLA